jgi:hypothetical protein
MGFSPFRYHSVGGSKFGKSCRDKSASHDSSKACAGVKRARKNENNSPGLLDIGAGNENHGITKKH